MRLYIKGYRTQNKILSESVLDAAHFYAHKLLGGRMYRHIELDIKLTKDLKIKDDSYGYCHILGDVEKPREFLIELDTSMKHSVGQILTWLAHEMVHLKQFVRGELFDYEIGQRVQWKSKTYKTSMEYNKQPWEREAYRLEDKLYKEFAEYYNGRC